MSRPLTPAKQRQKAEQALQHLRSKVGYFAKSDNPQTKQAYNEITGQIIALESVLAMMNGNNAEINIWADRANS